MDARLAKIYRQQRHSRDGDDSASDDDDEGLSYTSFTPSDLSSWINKDLVPNNPSNLNLKDKKTKQNSS